MNKFHNYQQIKSKRCKNLQQIYYCSFVGINLFIKTFYLRDCVSIYTGNN